MPGEKKKQKEMETLSFFSLLLSMKTGGVVSIDISAVFFTTYRRGEGKTLK